jgi:hypothetical protein
MYEYNVTTLEQETTRWIYQWVSIYNTALEAIPCPFAKQAVLDNKISYCYCSDPEDIARSLKNLAENGFVAGKEVLVIGIDPTVVSPIELQALTLNANQTYLKEAELIALEDHPAEPEIINGAAMNQGQWALLLVQTKAKLNKASVILEKQGYYKNWSQDNIDDVVSWRKDIDLT